MDRDPSVLNIVLGLVAATLLAVVMVYGVVLAEREPLSTPGRNGNRTTTTTSLEPL
jgi:ABC-type Co2+ transport system permease subunit